LQKNLISYRNPTFYLYSKRNITVFLSFSVKNEFNQNSLSLEYDRIFVINLLCNDAPQMHHY